MTDSEIIRPFGRPQKVFLGCMGVVLALVLGLSANSLVASTFGWIMLGMGGVWSISLAAFLLLPTKIFWVLSRNGIIIRNGLGEGGGILETISYESMLRLEWFSDRYAILRPIFFLEYLKDGKPEILRISSYQLGGIKEVCDYISKRIPGRSRKLSWKEAMRKHHASEIIARKI